ncbi:MAG: type I methionyl aminopeptidase, partial [Acidobacteria bacterium]|nr:type I methionyl aminopeptidase [Acidobacteriota bacterium]
MVLIREQIRYKSRREIEKMRQAARIAANALRVAARAAKPGV